jgi:hypothetical protein
MAAIFPASGDVTQYNGFPPNLHDVLITGIDNAEFFDGWGTIIPLGGGGSQRNKLTYGPSAEATTDLPVDIGITGQLLSYDVSDFDSQTLTRPRINPLSVQLPEEPEYKPPATGIPELSPILSNVSDWESTDTIMYSVSQKYYWEHAWTLLDVAAITSWNDFAADTDGSFLLLATDSGIYKSTDTGASWGSSDPGSENYLYVGCSGATGNGIALGEDARLNGKVWKTSNYGSSWAEVTVTVV